MKVKATFWRTNLGSMKRPALGSTLVCSMSLVSLPSLGVVQEVPVFGAWVPLLCFEPVLLLEQGVGDDELMLRTELQKQAPVVIAVANAVSN